MLVREQLYTSDNLPDPSNRVRRAEVWCGLPTLEVVGATVNANGEGAVIFVVDSNDGLFQSEAAAASATHHLVFGLGAKGRSRELRIEGVKEGRRGEGMRGELREGREGGREKGKGEEGREGGE